MMEHQVRRPQHSRRPRRRVGRGDASGHGSYSGKGMKGQKSRSGGGVRPGFEGGQTPLIKRLPEKRGFTNIFKKKYVLVKVGSLNILSAEEKVTPQSLVDQGILPSLKLPVKILGDGELNKPLIVSAHRFSNSARRKIEEKGGKVEELSS